MRLKQVCAFGRLLVLPVKISLIQMSAEKTYNVFSTVNCSSAFALYRSKLHSLVEVRQSPASL